MNTNFTWVKKFRKSLTSAFMLILLLNYIQPAQAGVCYTTTSGSSNWTIGTNLGGNGISCTAATSGGINSTGYFEWDGIAGQTYTFHINAGSGWTTAAYQYWQYNGSSWSYQSEGQPGASNFTITPSISDPSLGAGWHLLVLFNGTSCTNNGGPAWPGTSATVTYQRTSGPLTTGISTNSSCWITDNAHQYTITCTGLNSSNNDWGGPNAVNALINYQGTNINNYGGYFSWNTSVANLSAGGFGANVHPVASGTGFVGQYGTGYGNAASTLISATQSFSNYTNTVVFTVQPTTSFPQATAINAISEYCQDPCNQQTGWTNNQLNFASSYASPATLASASPANGTTVCQGYGNVSCTATAGSGGSGGTDIYQYCTNGSTFSAYTIGSNIPTGSATNNIIVQSQRQTTCVNSGWSTIATWPVSTSPAAGSITPNVANGTSICPTTNISATMGAGSGGTGSSDIYQYSTNGGSTWSTYTSGSTINGVSGQTLQIRNQRTAGTGSGCSVANNTYSWPVFPAPAVSNFSVASATSPCPSGSSTVTVNSTTLGNGTFTVTYSLTGTNTASNQTATLTMASNTGTFTIPGALLPTAGSSTVTVTSVANASCGTAVSSGTGVTVNPNPTVNAGSALTAFCQTGTSAALGGSVGGGATGGTWTDGGVGGTFNSGATNLNTTWTPPSAYYGTATLTLTTSGGFCGTTAASKTQVVNPNPTVNAGSALAAICQQQTSAALGGSVGGGATGGTWTDGGVGGTFNSGATSLNTTWTPPSAYYGTATLTLTTSGGSCGTVNQSKNQVVNQIPTVNVGSALTAFCQTGTSAALGGSIGGAATLGTWTDGGVGGTFNPSATTLNATWTPPSAYYGTATLTLTASGGLCANAVASKTQLVNPNPTVNAGSALSAICQGQTSAALGGSVGGGATGGTWTDGGVGGTFNSGATSLNTTWTPPSAYYGTATLTLTTSGGSCGTVNQSKNQVVNQIPTVNAGSALATICQGSTSAALGGSIGGAATLGTWTDGGVGGTFNPSATTLNATWTPPSSYSGTATLTLTASGGLCSNVTASKTQVVGATPTASAGGALAQICQGGTSGVLSGSVGGSATGGVWSDGGLGGTFNSGVAVLTNTYTPPSSFSGTVTLTLTTTGGPCPSVSSSTTLLVNGSIVPGTVSGAPATIPLGGTVTYQAVGFTGTFSMFQYQWNGTVSTGWTNWGTTNPYSWVSSSEANTLYVRAVIVNGACTVYSPPVGTLVISSSIGWTGQSTSGTAPALGSCGNWSSSWCAGSGTYTYATLVQGISYSVQNLGTTACGNALPNAYMEAWYSGGSTSCGWGATGVTGLNYLTFTAPISGSHIINVTSNATGADNNSCGAAYGWDGTTNSAVLQYKQNTTVTASVGSATVCYGGTNNLISTLSGGGNNPAVSWAVTSGGGTISGTTYSAGTYTGSVTVQATVGVCSSTATFTVNSLVASNLTVPAAVCTNGSAAMSCTLPVTWSVSSGSVNNSSGTASTFTPAAITAPTQNQTVTITATNSGCSVTATIRVDNKSIITPPTAVCTNGTAAISSNVAGVTWSASAGSVSPTTGLNTTLTPAVITAPTQNQTVTITAVNGVCTSTATTRVDNLNSITAPTANPSPVCDNSTLGISGNISGVVWAQSPSIGSIGGSPGQNITFTPTALTGTTQSATTTISATNGVCAAQTLNVRVDHNLAGAISAPAAVCTNSTEVITSSVAGVSWSASAGSVSPTTGLNTTLTPAAITAPTQNQTVTITATNGACSATTTTRVDRQNGITSPTANPSPVCDNATLAIAGNTSGVVWTQSPSMGSIGGSPGQNITFTPNAVPSNSQNTSTTITATNGLCSTTLNVRVDHNLSSISAPAALCTNNTIQISSGVQGISWSASAGSVSPATGQYTTLTPAAIAAPTQNQTVTITATNGACSNTLTTRVDNLNSITSPSGNPVPVCDNSTLAVTGNISGIVWTMSQPIGSIATSPGQNITFTPTALAGNTQNATTTLVATNGVCTPQLLNVRVDHSLGSVTVPAAVCTNSTESITSGVQAVTWTASAGSVSPSTGQNTILTPAAITAPTQNQTVTITATNGACSVTATTRVDNLNSITSPTANPSPVCDNSTLPVHGNISGVVWTIANGAVGSITSPGQNTTLTPTALTGSTQNATTSITATNGVCPSSTVNVRVDHSSVANAGPNQQQCNSTTFTLAGNNPSYATGLWTITSGPGSITTPTAYNSTVTGVTAGSSTTLQWTLTNGSCSSSSTVTLQNDVSPSTNAGPDQHLCSTGTFTMAATAPSVGTGTWTLLSGTATIVSPNSNTSQITGVPNGTNAVLQWSINNGTCNPTSTVTLYNEVIAAAVISSTNVQCNGASDGTVTISTLPTGGFGPYQYSLNSGAYQSSTSFTGLAPASYSAVSQDIYGCISPASNSVSITEPTVLTSPSISRSNVTCFGLGNGKVTVFIRPTGGTSPYQYSLNGGTYQTSTQFLNLVPGTYTVTAKDAHGCTSTSNTVTITEPAPLATAALVGTNVTCNGFANGSVTVSPLPTGGTPPYLYSFNGSGYNPQTTYGGLSPGTYNVIIEDAHGCVLTTNNVTITQPNVLTLNATNDGPYYGTSQTMHFFNPTTGGTAPYSYSWTGPLSWSSNASDPSIPNAIVPMTGNYDVTVTDANGCSTTSFSYAQVNSSLTYTWTGITSTDWFDNTNWSPNPILGVAGCWADVYIPGGTPYSPTLNTANNVGNLQVDANATLTLNANLALCKDLTGGSSCCAHYGVVTGGATLILKGDVLEKVNGLVKVNILKLDNIAGAQAQPNATLEIATSLDLQLGNFDAGSGNVTFLSPSSSQVGIIDNFSANYNGTMSGTIKAQRYYEVPTTANSYTQHFMGSPVNNPAFSQFGAAGTPGYLVAVPTCDESTIAVGSPYSTVLALDETHGAVCTSNQWVAITSGNAQNGVGYAVGKQVGPGIITLTGTANLNTTYSVNNLTNSGWANTFTLQHPAGAYPGISSGWHLVSNPYLATLEINTPSSGFDNQVQVWNTFGPYAGSYTQGIVGTNAVISPFQGFMVHKSTPGGTATYTLNAGDRVRTPQTFYRANDNELTIVAENMTNHLLDKTFVAFNTAATDQFDPQYDADKPFGRLNRHTLYTVNSNKWMGINVLHDIAQTSTVPMGFEPGATSTFNFNFTGISTFDPTSYVYLEDKAMAIMHNVRSGDYSFSSDSSDVWDRFVLHFTPPATMSVTDATCSGLGMINVLQPGTANWNYTLVDNTSHVISSGTLNQSAPLSVSAASGTYTLTLTDVNNYTVTEIIQVNGPDMITAAFTAPTSVQDGQNVVLTSTTANASNYQWNMGDGQTETGAIVNYTYGGPGSYTVVLTVTNLSGCTSTASQTIDVNAAIATGLNTIENKGIGIWSSENRVYVDFRQQQKVDAVISIFDVLGQQISNEKFTTNALYQRIIDNVEAAYMIVSVKTGDKVITKKVFINNIR